MVNLESRSQAATPLRPAVFQILLALSEVDRHGLGIADEVEVATEGTLRLGPGTLYRSLKEMTHDGLIQELESPRGDEDPRRKFYRITALGRKLLRAEALRYENIVKIARRRDVLPQSR